MSADVGTQPLVPIDSLSHHFIEAASVKLDQEIEIQIPERFDQRFEEARFAEVNLLQAAPRRGKKHEGFVRVQSKTVEIGAARCRARAQPVEIREPYGFELVGDKLRATKTLQKITVFLPGEKHQVKIIERLPKQAPLYETPRNTRPVIEKHSR